jgi:hypothetical protein
MARPTSNGNRRTFPCQFTAVRLKRIAPPRIRGGEGEPSLLLVPDYSLLLGQETGTASCGPRPSDAWTSSGVWCTKALRSSRVASNQLAERGRMTPPER